MKPSSLRTIPEPRAFPLVGSLHAVDPSRPIESFQRLGERLGGIYRIRLPGQTLVVVSEQKYVNEICDETRFEKVITGPLLQFRDFVGDALFTAHNDEPHWRIAHRVLLPAFGPSALENYFEPMLDITDQMLDKWERLGPNANLDVGDNMTRLTLDTIGLCGFGCRFNSFYQTEMHPFIDAILRTLKEGGARANRLELQNKMLVLKTMQMERDKGVMYAFTDELIEQTRRAPDLSSRKDLLSLMLLGRDPETGEGLSDENVRYQALTFLIAGHETTSGLLSFATYALLNHPDVLRKAVDEVDRVLGKNPQRRPTFAQLRELRTIDALLRETLRFWPTAPGFIVAPREDTFLDGTHPLKKGDPILVLTALLHRDPAVWGPEPDTFRLENFSPEAIAERAPNAWKPFGNGMRACIGSQFAMQEATLAIARLLQRFELVDYARYDLKVKETLTIKPDNFFIRVRPRPRTEGPSHGTESGTLPIARGTEASLAHGATARVTSPSKAPRHETPLLVLYGSNTGSCEGFARRFASKAHRQGFAPTVAPMDQATGQLPDRGAVIIITASYNGKAPDNAGRFCAWLDTLPPGALPNVRYAVLGCGHHDWPATYQAVPRRVDAALAAAGARRVADRGEANAGGDFQGAFEAWSLATEKTLLEVFEIAVEPETKGPRIEIDQGEGQEDLLAARHAMQGAAVLENRELVDMNSPFARSKRHLELRLPEGVSYTSGDHLAVLGENPPELIERVAKRFAIDPEKVIVLRSRHQGGEHGSDLVADDIGHLPLNKPVAVRTLLGRFVELSQPATRGALQALASHTVCPPHQVELMTLAKDEARYNEEILQKRVTVLDLLEQYPACMLPFAEYLDLMPAMQPRRYSISSSPKVDPQRVTLTVAIVDSPSWSGRGRFQGTASSFLARLSPGATISCAIKTPHGSFRLPHETDTPILLIGAGTGMAPLRGFLEERATLKRQGKALGRALLFFGCDHPEVDFLYKDELLAWQEEGVVDVFPAFFKDEREGVTFVQHRLWKERALVAALLDEGAHVYVCGDGRFMEPAVRGTLAKIHADHKGLSDEEGARWLVDLEGHDRYHADIFGA